MKNLTLKSIDKNNWEEAINLSVREDQQRFIASNLYSIAEVQFLDSFYAKGIFLDDRIIGFTMYGIDSDDHNYWIYRLMIDQKYQGTGLGVHAVKRIVDEIRGMNNQQIPLIMIGYHPENLAAKFVYKKAGFVEGELASWGEQLAALSI
ncbi:GNAT family N-acetyltransferase [Bacillus suaedae]|uniref:GNAT family N-acetyltransferase n=1 Tax=Halalkalibacter suaedae TaxID=2822140 RepID=A0A940WW57_9BACI|nr:GNAT family N-acetyltransferase [Bacillus suaedae]MBP3953525.1 GNAT family N-acetyltransferase [Bacillus suaedae]